MHNVRAIRRCAGIVAMEFLEGMSGDPAQPGDDSGVLHGHVGIIELGANHPDFRSERMANHLVEPFWMDGFEIVVEETNDFASGMLYREVVDGGEIERAGARNNAEVSAVFLLFVERKQLGIVGLVVGDQEFKIWILGFGSNALDAGNEEFATIPGWDDQRNERHRFGQFVADVPVLAFC